MGIYGCSSEVIIFFGIYVPSDSLLRPIEAYCRIKRPLAVLDILAARRRSNPQGSSVFDASSATSRVPEEVWHEIRSSLISQELEILEENAKVGMGKSCGAGKRVKMKPSEKWTCDFQKQYPDRRFCQSCQEYLKYGFRIRAGSKQIRDSLLAKYNLFYVNEAKASRLEGKPYHLGIAVHPTEKSSKLSVVHGEGSYNAFCSPRLSLPSIDEASSSLQVARFLKDFGIEINEDPFYEVQGGPYRYDEDGEREKLIAPAKQVLEYSGNPPSIPQWRIAHREDLS